MLSPADYQNWIQCLQSISNAKQELHAWLAKDLRQFFPFDRALLGYGIAVADEIRVEGVVAVDHTPEYLAQLGPTFDIRQRGCMAGWLKNRQPFVIYPDRPPTNVSFFELKEIEQFGLRNIAGHGILSLHANAGTYCSFCGLPEKPDDWIFSALELMAPVLNDLMLVHVLAQAKAHAQTRVNIASMELTESQRLIVRLASDGFPDKAIASSLGLSAKAVRNQLSRAYSVLGVHNRTQLAALMRGV